LIPSDVGLGPYDLPPVEPKTAWEFNTDGTLEGWSGNGDLSDLQVKGGLLAGRSTGADPILQVGGLQVEADRVRRLSFRMRTDTSDRVQVFWATTLAATSGEASLGIDVVGDGQFHDYEIDLGASPHWRGIVTVLRIDPANRPGPKFAFDYVRLR